MDLFGELSPGDQLMITLTGQYMVSSNLCMPYWIRDQEGRLVRIENPQDTELDICVNIMDPPPEDQNSQQGQGENEKFHECWERYMESINACPHHGFDTWLLVSYFYDGMSSSMKQILETMCGGDFMSKNPDEAMDFLSYVAEVSRGWDEPNSREKGKFPSQQTQNPKAGMYMLSEDVDMKAKVATLARRLEELELKKMHEVQAISETQAQAMPCTICQPCDHVVDECPTMPAVREMLGDQVNVVGNLGPTTVHPMVTPTIQAGEKPPKFLLETKTTSIPTTRPNPSTSTTIFSGASHCKPNFTWKEEIKNSSEILEVLRQVKVTKNAFLTEQVSAIIQTTGLGGLKPTTMTLSLADRKLCANHPRETFLATSNAIVNCRNGVMQLTFGNMTLELNIFHLCKRHLYPEEEEGFEEVCLINTLVEEHCDKSLEESLNENLEVLEDGFPEPSDVLAIMSPWRRREEILPLFNQEDSQGVAVEDPPKLILKPLPVELKYAYLEDDEKCPVVFPQPSLVIKRIVF
ncbi:hypothetical protein CK203_113037 [Vitis vinifera]|uniref:Retrotransposon gag domain-containing protein n=1 Tax=Vitis vinifera TaxID=29760 RepID=A0A438BL99_VITVI|nr:hypothetical protein CK203_113037 [Vitis vinifera]